jgi:hypothetical protein
MSENLSELKGIGIFKLSMFLAFIFSFFFCLFYNELFWNFSDLSAHIALVSFKASHPLSLPEVGFELTVYWLAKLCHLGYAQVGVLLLSTTMVVLAIMVSSVLEKYLNLKTNLNYFFTSLLLVVSSIYYPFFNKFPYLGQWSPNPRHNPTILLMEPFALGALLLTIPMLQKHKVSTVVQVALLLVISMFYKPSFAMVYIPAAFIFLIFYKPRVTKNFVLMFFAVIPAILYFSWQYFSFQHAGLTVAWSPFKMLTLYTPNPFISLTLAIAFPLSLLIFRFRNVLNNKYLLMAWLITLVGYMQSVLLAQGGDQLACANFAWGYLAGLFFLFVFSFVEFWRWLQSDIVKKIDVAKLSITSFLFSLHLASGIVYLIRMIFYSTYN